MKEFILSLLIGCHSNTLTECHRFHTAQVFSTYYIRFLDLLLIYIKVFLIFKKDITVHVSHNIYQLFVHSVFINYGKRNFYQGQSYGTIYHQFYIYILLYYYISVTEAATVPSFKFFYLLILDILLFCFWCCFCVVSFSMYVIS